MGGRLGTPPPNKFARGQKFVVGKIIFRGNVFSWKFFKTPEFFQRAIANCQISFGNFELAISTSTLVARFCDPLRSIKCSEFPVWHGSAYFGSAWSAISWLCFGSITKLFGFQNGRQNWSCNKVPHQSVVTSILVQQGAVGEPAKIWKRCQFILRGTYSSRGKAEVDWMDKTT